MNPFFNSMSKSVIPNPMQNMMNFIRQYQQIKQNPSQLAPFLKQQGMIDDTQFAQIKEMGNNYEQIGHYLMNNGRMPTNVQKYDSQVNQIQNMMQNEQNQ